MSATISRTFIRARYVAALALIGLLCLGGVFVAERAAQDFNRIAEAYGRSESLNRQVLKTMTAVSQRVVGFGYRRDMADRSLLAQVLALEADGALFGADLERIGSPFAPFLLTRERGGRDFAVFVSLARDLASAIPLTDDAVDRRYTQLLRISDTLVQPFFQQVGADLAHRHAEVWSELLRRLGYVALGMIAVLTASGFVIFLPMERRILSTQAALARETDRAQEAERSKGVFLANMSHEIRTSLAGVLGMTDLVAGTRLDAEQRRYVEIMRGSGRSLLRIINDILDFTKVAAGELPFEAKPFDPARMLVETGQLFAPVVAAKGLDFVLDIDPATPRAAIGDGLRIGQIATNLLHNAAKFTETGSITLGAEWRAEAGALRIAVADTGVGIAADEVGRVFERFRQLDNAAAPRAVGTGLGLALAKSLAEQMGGRIGVESAPGLGSTFWIEIPLQAPAGAAPFGRPGEGLSATRSIADPRLDRTTERWLAAWGCAPAGDGPASVLIVDSMALGADPALRLGALRAQHPGARVVALVAAGAEMPEADATVMTPVDPDALLAALRPRAHGKAGATAPRLAASRAGGKALRVLIAEDNDVNRLIATKLLEGLGCVVETAADGAEAVRRAAESRPDLILMDVSMPRMSGLEAAAEIRRRETSSGAPRTPIVALTAHAMAEHRERCLAAGMDDHLTKPFSADMLAATVARWSAGDARRGALTA